MCIAYVDEKLDIKRWRGATRFNHLDHHVVLVDEVRMQVQDRTQIVTQRFKQNRQLIKPCCCSQFVYKLF